MGWRLSFAMHCLDFERISQTKVLRSRSLSGYIHSEFRIILYWFLELNLLQYSYNKTYYYKAELRNWTESLCVHKILLVRHSILAFCIYIDIIGVKCKLQHGSVVVSTVTSQQRVPDLIPGWDLSVWSLHVLPVYAWVLSRDCGFLPLSKNMHVRLIGDSKLSVGVSVSVYGCVLFVSVWPCDGLAKPVFFPT